MASTHTFTKREIIQQFKFGNPTEDREAGIAYIFQSRCLEPISIPPATLAKIQASVSALRSASNSRWDKSHSYKVRFETQNQDWLDSEFLIPSYALDSAPSSSQSVPGRPRLSCDEKAHSSKKRDAALLSKAEGCDPTKLMLAAMHSAKTSGKKDLLPILTEASKSPNRPAKMRRVLFQTPISKYSAEEALALILDLSLSKSQYMSLRSGAAGKGADIYPEYRQVIAAKEQCRPKAENISINETEASVDLQYLLDHTSTRIALLQSEIIVAFMEKEGMTSIASTLVCSWGFDGSSGHSSYKQKYNGPDGSDENLSVTTLIPLRLTTESGTILWNNRTPQSPRYCRAVKMQFKKDSKDLVMEEKARLNANIERLCSFDISLTPHILISVKYWMFLALIGGKVLNFLTATKSAQSCPICHATPKTFNDLANIDNEVFTPQPNSLQYGISPLHSWIRLFECCLHISYRLAITPPVWQVRSQDQKESFNRRKIYIQQELWRQLIIKVDRPKQGGSGSSNDGNMARRAFSNPQLFVTILGLNVQLVNNFQTILIALSCQFPLDVTLFSSLCVETARMFVSIYHWYPMPAAVHKILIHGAQIIVNSILPVGMLAEDAAEARNKYYKEFRLYHARKTSKLANMQDIFHRTLDTSDPLVSTLSLASRIKKLRKNPLSRAVVALFAIPAEEGSIPYADELQQAEEDVEEEEDICGTAQFMEHLEELCLTDTED